MDQKDKIRHALTAIIKHSSCIVTLEQDLVNANRRREEAKGEVIRVLKALGQRQVLFQGQVYALGTNGSPTGKETRDEFLTINKFTGLVLPDGSTLNVQDPAKEE